MSEKYNGWTNYATWRVNLEICTDLAESLRDDYLDSVESLATFFKDQVDEIISNESAGIALDYARAFVNDVDWQEIAEAHKYELLQTEEEDA